MFAGASVQCLACANYMHVTALVCIRSACTCVHSKNLCGPACASDPGLASDGNRHSRKKRRRSFVKVGSEHVLADAVELVTALFNEHAELKERQASRSQQLQQRLTQRMARRILSFRGFFDTDVPHLLITLENAGTFLDCNESLARLLGSCRHQVLESRSLAVLPTTQSLGVAFQRMAPALAAFGNLEVRDFLLPDVGAVVDAFSFAHYENESDPLNPSAKVRTPKYFHWISLNIRALSTLDMLKLDPKFRPLQTELSEYVQDRSGPSAFSAAKPPLDWVRLGDAYPGVTSPLELAGSLVELATGPLPNFSTMTTTLSMPHRSVAFDARHTYTSDGVSRVSLDCAVPPATAAIAEPNAHDHCEDVSEVTTFGVPGT